MPSVRIWDMEDQSHPQIAEMTKGHKFGVACVVCKINTSIKHRIILACATDRTKLVKSICETSLKSLLWVAQPNMYQDLIMCHDFLVNSNRQSG